MVRSGSTAPRVEDRVVDEARRGRRAPALEGAALVEAGQQQEVVDEAAHAHGFLLGAAHGLAEAGLVVEGAALVELGVAPDRGDRRAQLVGGVGDELAQPLLGRLRALVERPSSMLPEHGVERLAELGRLGARRRRLDAVGQVALGDGRGRGRSSA